MWLSTLDYDHPFHTGDYLQTNTAVDLLKAVRSDWAQSPEFRDIESQIVCLLFNVTEMPRLLLFGENPRLLLISAS